MNVLWCYPGHQKLQMGLGECCRIIVQGLLYRDAIRLVVRACIVLGAAFLGVWGFRFVGLGCLAVA